MDHPHDHVAQRDTGAGDAPDEGQQLPDGTKTIEPTN